MVGRPREFDENLVLDAVMEAFWTRGYEATSLADLMQATGLHKGSLYQAFGDKHTLFIQALKRYLQEMRRQKNELLKAAPTPLDGVRNVAHAMIEMADDTTGCPKGCMAINALVELAPHDPEVQVIMEDHIRRMRSSMEETIARGQEAGQITDERSPEMLTSMTITFMAGLATQVKGGVTHAQAHELLDAQFAAMF